MNAAGFAAALAGVPGVVREGARDLVVRAPPLKEILERWDAIRPLLLRATERTQGCYEPEDVLGQVHIGRCTLLVIEEAGTPPRLLVVVVTEVRDYPRRRVLDVSFIGGLPSNDTGVAEWAPLLVANLEDTARKVGATMLSGTGRVGWARAGGYKIIGGYMTRLLT